MAGKRGAGKLMVTAAALTLPLWLGCCSPGSDPSAGRAFTQGAATIERTAPAEGPLVPAPQPQAPPPPETGRSAAPAQPGTGQTGTARTDPAQPSQTELGPATPAGSAGSETEQTAPGGATATTPPEPSPRTDPAVTARPSPTPQTPSPQTSETPAETASGRSAGTRTVTAYYVLIDDGGARGVRFGCNDSLAGIRRSAEDAVEPLPAAMRALLDGSAAEGLYNALAESSLTFLSGSFDGTTVTVYLSGTISLGGTCDVPRVEAQLTQTAVASVGAIRAEVYINGTPLAEALRLK
ncbi:GerMN domain-containing protein [Pseudarthrobacter sp. DSP2-3-2b1]|uniref:GerMN domain-containing protein n=1 Tax=Pseudarthrobacter sp. DSP2-3-2b1 TaxID=2804661 RepID=UPI003CF0FA1D